MAASGIFRSHRLLKSLGLTLKASYPKPSFVISWAVSFSRDATNRYIIQWVFNEPFADFFYSDKSIWAGSATFLTAVQILARADAGCRLSATTSYFPILFSSRWLITCARVINHWRCCLGPSALLGSRLAILRSAFRLTYGRTSISVAIARETLRVFEGWRFLIAVLPLIYYALTCRSCINSIWDSKDERNLSFVAYRGC